MLVTSSSEARVDVWPGTEWIFEVSMQVNVQKFIILSPLSQRAGDNFRVTSLSASRVESELIAVKRVGFLSAGGMIRWGMSKSEKNDSQRNVKHEEVSYTTFIKHIFIDESVHFNYSEATLAIY
jgi:hypothetical protein